MNQCPINNLTRKHEKGGEVGGRAKGDERGYTGSVMYRMLTRTEKVKSKSQCAL